MTEPLRILHVASEMVPLIKTGGLADVLGALPMALNAHGHDARGGIPGFRSALAAAQKLGLTWGGHTMTIEAGGGGHPVGGGGVGGGGGAVYLNASDQAFAR